MGTLILGIDPGTIITGYGVIEVTSTYRAIDFGCIKPPSKAKLESRYLILFESIESLIEKYQPDAISTETQYVKKNVQSAIKLGMARGMVLLAAARNKVPFFEYTPSVAKKAVVGNGSASKNQVQKMTKALLSLKSIPEPEDAADALALAIAHAHTIKTRKSCTNT